MLKIALLRRFCELKLSKAGHWLVKRFHRGLLQSKFMGSRKW